ncbi:MAG: hypothetical protein QOD62_1983, partial [Actinomycetota bacterium]|nr:hypothetical protein [Actinomycetota bacterium]
MIVRWISLVPPPNRAPGDATTAAAASDDDSIAADPSIEARADAVSMLKSVMPSFSNELAA